MDYKTAEGLALEAAKKEFLKHVPDLKPYKVAIFLEYQGFVVSFTDKSGPSGGRGNLRPLPGFEVRLSPVDLKVFAANFIR